MQHKRAHCIVEGLSHARRPQPGGSRLGYDNREGLCADRPVVGIRSRERELVGRAGEVRLEHERVRRVDDDRLRGPAEQLVGMVAIPVVERVVAGDEDGKAALGRPAGATDLLTERRDRAREPVADARIEPADVDPELERRGGHDASKGAVEQLAFDGPSFGRQVAAAVRTDGVGQTVTDHPSGPCRHDLGASAAAGEGDRTVPLTDELRQQQGRGLVGRGGQSLDRR